ncbi:SIMPL domain-containing protein [Williamsia herbipolensis]|uniref:SIMPL domain-containing protein n=1 Tax=Williamsia herbipolensis TaxID=1603258 RepID=UPI0005F78B12|nr:SIMPL domain-containing protein [Williamsia herbipolensis]
MTRQRWALRALGAAAVLTTLSAVAACGSDSPASTSSSDGPPAVSVSGTGEVEGAPDTLTAQIGVETQAGDVTAAIEASNAAITTVTNAVVSAGVNRADVQTQQVSITPQYSGALPGGTNAISGYQATNTLRVTVRDLSKASTVLGDAVSAGGNAARLSGVSFRVDDISKLLSDARSRAFADAKKRAEEYAKLSGSDLGKVLSISENVSGQEQSSTADSARSAQSLAVPIEPGQQTVSVSVNVKWALS